MDFSYVHIRYFIGYVYHICLQDTIQSTLSLCLLCQAMLLPMPLRPLLLTTRSGFSVIGNFACPLLVSSTVHYIWATHGMPDSEKGMMHDATFARVSMQHDTRKAPLVAHVVVAKHKHLLESITELQCLLCIL